MEPLLSELDALERDLESLLKDVRPDEDCPFTASLKSNLRSCSLSQSIHTLPNPPTSQVKRREERRGEERRGERDEAISCRKKVPKSTGELRIGDF
jgi:hypothetical protein